MKIRRCINIDKKLWELLQELANKENRSASNMLEELIKEKVNK